MKDMKTVKIVVITHIVMLAMIAIPLFAGSKPAGEVVELNVQSNDETIVKLIELGIDEKIANGFSDERLAQIKQHMGENGENLQIAVQEEYGVHVLYFLLNIGDGKYFMSLDVELDKMPLIDGDEFIGSFLLDTFVSAPSRAAYTIATIEKNGFGSSSEITYKNNIDSYDSMVYAGRHFRGAQLYGVGIDIPKSGIYGLSFMNYKSFIAHYEAELVIKSPDTAMNLMAGAAYVRTTEKSIYNYAAEYGSSIQYLPDNRTEE